MVVLYCELYISWGLCSTQPGLGLSLIHISSKWWDLGRKKGGLFVLSPYTSKDNSSWFRGTADSMYQNISFLKRSNEPYVAISSGDAVYKMNYKKILEFHKEKEADITIVYKRRCV